MWVQGHIKFNVMTYEHQSPMLIKMVGEPHRERNEDEG